MTRGMLQSTTGSELPGLVSELLVAKASEPRILFRSFRRGTATQERRKGTCLHLPQRSLSLVAVRMSGVLLSGDQAEATPKAHLVTPGGGIPTSVLQMEALEGRDYSAGGRSDSEVSFMLSVPMMGALGDGKC